MYALVKYSDGIYYIVLEKYIYKKCDKISVKYKDGNCYEATIISYHENKKVLQTLMDDLSNSGDTAGISKRRNKKIHQKKKQKQINSAAKESDDLLRKDKDKIEETVITETFINISNEAKEISKPMAALNNEINKDPIWSLKEGFNDEVPNDTLPLSDSNYNQIEILTAELLEATLDSISKDNKHIENPINLKEEYQLESDIKENVCKDNITFAEQVCIIPIVNNISPGKEITDTRLESDIQETLYKIKNALSAEELCSTPILNNNTPCSLRILSDITFKCLENSLQIQDFNGSFNNNEHINQDNNLNECDNHEISSLIEESEKAIIVNASNSEKLPNIQSESIAVNNLSASNSSEIVIYEQNNMVSCEVDKQSKPVKRKRSSKSNSNQLAEHVAIHMEKTSEIQCELGARVTAACLQLHGQNRGEDYILPPGAEIGTPIFELYFALQDFVNMKEHLSQSDHKSLSITKYHEWFVPAVEKWLDLAKLKAILRVRRAAELDRICTGDYYVKHCTSAIDATACFYRILEFWRKLAWPDLPGSYDFVLKVIDAICSSAAYYAEITHQQLADSGYYEEQTPYKTTDEMCVAVNGLEYVRKWLLDLGEHLRVKRLLAALESHAGESIRIQWRNALLSPLEQTPGQMLLFINQIISRIGGKMRAPLKKAMFHLAWSPDSLPTSEAIIPLLEYLDVHLLALNTDLLPSNFVRVLQDIWEVVLSELSNQMDGNTGEKPAMFYERLYEALDLLAKFFHADEKGLSYDALRCDSFLNVEERLTYHKTETIYLIDRYYQQRLQDQMNTTSSEYGVLTVRAYLNHDSLCVEVINARDVIPLDPNGFSDPFVIIELLPRRVFEHCAEQQTNVKKKTLHPMFDECFEFSVNVEQCRSPDAMVLFTVMDHDVLTANDFAGEAFLGLSTIPGVADTNTSSDNFHGLKHQELPLMHQKNRNHPILQILESRVGDKMALDFVKKQKQRFAT